MAFEDVDFSPEVDVSSRERAKMEEVIELFLEARRRLGSDGSFTTRVLLDMLLLDLGRELVALSGKKSD
ncbi:hypothetical protein [Methylobacterium haplocladii]|uniref:Centromere protein X n=1 Tax=Methylobacterium haplocladii TaxID=1176176 RepID=A0A512IMR8_9HYPH|nr:hypothetical protein [Methylobacterium haplocladii]GEO99009.1 hypothetical protein MHA02_13970 [Methylobacterium haplocladii]GLS61501.1 hypothetical protein GCM10007887_42150 [Methylobacterium haplocladii]